MSRGVRLLAGPVLFASLVVAWLLITAIDGRAIVLTPSLHLSPMHGQVSAGFVATYTLSPCQISVGTSIDFYWDEYPPSGGQRLGSAPSDATCTARLSTASPAAAAQGSHLVYGFVALPDGSPLNGTVAAAAYTIDPPPMRATPSPSASASSGATPGPSNAVTSPGSIEDHDSRLPGGLQSSGPGAGAGGSKAGPPQWVTTPLGQISLVEAIFAAGLLALLVLAIAVWFLTSRTEGEKQPTDKAA